ncbi:heavy metal translocating P-type ATPase [Marinobacter halophilus]|uniref:Copper-translocating P-type ATPase n=1 Tax=Marinobacter halophilus TaxID=1323740 RepID=A0A2T1K8Y8_9GAMM|nr:heavy metal translocating P-type ATPase [Marinobacter halophilus]PSF06609.1 copper-translocating P-type ATPase [Marinobacter halophilus]GGC74086.1 copper-translocating P-type ATPase [Marinobacter halophilus]
MNHLNCFHCGEPADGNPPIILELDGTDRHFCCQGCKAVCETIRSEGLTGFYDFRTEPAITPRQLTRSELSRIKELDHPLVQQSFVAPVKGGQEAQLLIGGITCAACIWLLENHLKRQPGVISFSVNHTTQRARLVWAQDQVRLSELLVAIYELGYNARPYQADEAEQALKAEHRSMLIRLVVAGAGSFQTMMLAFPLYFELISELSPEFVSFFRWFSLLVATPVVLYSARPFFENARRDLASRHLTMDVPVAIAIGLAFGASAWVTAFGGEEVYFESVCMFTFFLLLGRYVEVQARYRAGLTGSALAGFQPTIAAMVRNGETDIVPAHQVRPGDIIRVRPGETLPIDGEIVSGESTLNEAALTGEYLPESRGPGDTVHAGSINGENPLDIRVVKAGAETRLSGILRILDRVQSEKPPVARMADRIAGKFVGRVLILAPIVWIGWALAGADNAFDITLSVLVVTCPCALSLATPTAITAASMRLRKLGFLPTRGHTLESLNSIDTVVFDKTGTLTRGELTLTGTRIFGAMGEAQALRLAAGLEKHSEHPIARVFHERSSVSVDAVTNHLGGGLSGQFNGQPVFIGHKAFVAEHSNAPSPEAETATGMEIWLATNDQWLASFQLDDQIRADAAQAIQALNNAGIQTLLLSGDRSGHVQQVARTLGIEKAIGEASPEQKLEVLEQLKAEGHKVMMVGDGLNDLPSMAGAGISVAMGAAADLTQLKADAVLLNGQLMQLMEAVKASQQTRKVIRQNMIWAFGYNLAALPLAAAGLVPPWLAAIGMSLSSLVVVLNALRLGSSSRQSPTTDQLGSQAVA